MNLGQIAVGMIMGFMGAYVITSNAAKIYKMSTKQSAIFFFGVYFVLFTVCYMAAR